MPGDEAGGGEDEQGTLGGAGWRGTGRGWAGGRWWRAGDGGRGAGPSPGGSWESPKAREAGMTQAELQEAESGRVCRPVGGDRAGSQEAGKGAGGPTAGRQGSPQMPSSPPPPPTPGPRGIRAGKGTQTPSPTLMLHLPPPPKDPCSPRGAPSLHSPLPLTPSVYAAPAGHPGTGRPGARGAPGAPGAPWAAAGDAGSSTRPSLDAPSWP